MPKLSLLLEDEILLISVVLLSSLLISGFLWLWRGCRRIRELFGGMAAELPERDTIRTRFGQSVSLLELWTSYEESLLVLPTGRVVATSRASLQFGVRSVFDKALPLRYIQALPALLVGVGILFTFIGLSIGLLYIETSSLNIEQITPLIDGMKTAFWSSVFGMFYSILFNLSEKYAISEGEKYVRAFRARLDTTYFIKDFELASELFGYRDENGNLVYPGYVLRDINKYSKEQSKALKSFTSDLSDGIKISAASLDGLREALAQVLQPTLENLEGGVSDRLEDIFKGGVQDIMERMSGETIAGLEQVGNTISSTAESLNGLPDLLKTLQDEMQAGMVDAGTKVQEETEVTLKAFQDLVSLMAGQMQDLTTRATDSASRLIEKNEKHTEKTSDLIERFDSTLRSVTSIVEKTGAAATSMAEIQENLTHISKDFLRASTTLNASANSLDKSAQSLAQGSEKIIDGMEEALANLRSSIGQSQKVLEESARQMTTIREGLSGVFAQIQSGLGTYQESTRNSLNRYLLEFSGQLSTAAIKLATTVETLEESLDGLNDNLSKLGVGAPGNTSTE